MRRVQHRGLSYNYPRTPGSISLHGWMTHSHYPCLGVPKYSLRGLGLTSGTEQMCGVTPYPPAIGASSKILSRWSLIQLLWPKSSNHPSLPIVQVFQSPWTVVRSTIVVPSIHAAIHSKALWAIPTRKPTEKKILRASTRDVLLLFADTGAQTPRHAIHVSIVAAFRNICGKYMRFGIYLGLPP
ncbi:hypothetical protein EDD17DRAFT_384472 [Pisolithus thermaeus]|nr:hypothetical protein EDD17DRAFT_384472 [Pisolithus thermaeus]